MNIAERFALEALTEGLVAMAAGNATLAGQCGESARYWLEQSREGV